MSVDANLDPVIPSHRGKDSTISAQLFLNYIVDFFKSYSMFEKDCKLSAFDQKAWDEMLWYV